MTRNYYKELYNKIKLLSQKGDINQLIIGDYSIDPDLDILLKSFAFLHHNLDNNIERARDDIVTYNLKHLFRFLIQIKPACLILQIGNNVRGVLDKCLVYSNTTMKFRLLKQEVFNMSITSSSYAKSNHLTNNMFFIVVDFFTKDPISLKKGTRLSMYSSDELAMLHIVLGNHKVYIKSNNAYKAIGTLKFDAYINYGLINNISSRYMSLITYCLYYNLFQFFYIQIDEDINIEDNITFYINCSAEQNTKNFLYNNAVFAYNVYSKESSGFTIGEKLIVNINQIEKTDTYDIIGINSIYAISKKTFEKFDIVQENSTDSNQVNPMPFVNWQYTITHDDNYTLIRFNVFDQQQMEVIQNEFVFYADLHVCNRINDNLFINNITFDIPNIKINDTLVQFMKSESDYNYFMIHLNSLLKIQTINCIFEQEFVKHFKQFIKTVSAILNINLDLNNFENIKISKSYNEHVYNNKFCSNIFFIEIKLYLRDLNNPIFVILLIELIKSFVPIGYVYDINLFINHRLYCTIKEISNNNDQNNFIL